VPDELDRLDEDRLLLGRRHGDRVLVQIAVRADLVAVIHDHLHLSGERLDRVARNEEARAELVLLEQVQEADGADLASEHATLDVRRRLAAALGADLAGNRIDVRAECAEDVLGHLPSFLAVIAACWRCSAGAAACRRALGALPVGGAAWVTGRQRGAVAQAVACA
jgi:hypothetical protein